MMSYRLALAFGKPVAELDEIISPDEWVGWLAYYSLEPWGCAVEDDRCEKIVRMLDAWLGNKPRETLWFDRDPKPVAPLPLDDKIKGTFARVKSVQEANALNN